MWKNKSGAEADPHPFWTWSFLTYTLSSATFPLNVRTILPDHFSDISSFYVASVCNHCHWTIQNHCLMMGLTSHLSCLSDVFSSYRVYFSLMTILTMMVLGPGHLLRALFHFPLKIPLVLSVKKIPLVMPVESFSCLCQCNIESWSCQWNIECWSNLRIYSAIRIDSTIRIDSHWLYSLNYVPAQKHSLFQTHFFKYVPCKFMPISRCQPVCHNRLWHQPVHPIRFWYQPVPRNRSMQNHWLLIGSPCKLFHTTRQVCSKYFFWIRIC